MAENKEDRAAIDIKCLVYHSINAQMSQDLFTSPNCCIFKTPTILLELNEKAYVPDAFSIGPFHHGHTKFEETEKIKITYLKGLISRSSSPEAMLKGLINSVERVEREARECYAGPIGYSPDEFVKMLVIDGCFIIEVFRKDSEGTADNDPIFSMSCMRQFLVHDLMLLENQVPWIVLECLFSSIKDFTNNNNADFDLIKLVKSYVVANLWISVPSHHPTIQEIKHILDLIRKLLVSSIGAGEGLKDWTPLPSATSLAEAGVKIRMSESKSFLDIKFYNGVLEIPPLAIHETTESFFRNIISFEQCYPNCEPNFTCYAKFLDNLINTPKDMDILCENKIIKNWLDPEDAVPFFNKLYYNTNVDKAYYNSLCEEVNKYCNNSWPRWRAMLVRKYFNTPWAILSTMAAVILLILTFVQTWYAVFKK